MSGSPGCHWCKGSRLPREMAEKERRERDGVTLASNTITRREKERQRDIKKHLLQRGNGRAQIPPLPALPPSTYVAAAVLTQPIALTIFDWFCLYSEKQIEEPSLLSGSAPVAKAAQSDKQD